jgi:phospholipase/lecithinase/hemolysin
MKRIFRSMQVAVLAMAACVAPAVASAAPPEELIIISGSLSDVGNYYALHGSFGPPFADNRSTNGPNLDDYFAELLHFDNKPSMHLVGPVMGNNFAVFQSLARGNGPEDLPAQVQAYLSSHGGRANPEALHLLLIGGSDVIDALLNPNDQASSQILDATVVGMENALRTLVNSGAKRVYAPNFTDLGYTPYAIKNGVTGRATRISREYNRKYAAMLDRFERRLRLQGRHDVEIIRWDFFAYTHRLFRHIEDFGFTNSTQSCIDLIPSNRCELDRFVFLSDFFPTSRTHQLFATAMAQNLIDRDRCRDNNGRFDTQGVCRNLLSGAEMRL